MHDRAFIDFETYSEAGYRQEKNGTWKSAGGPHTEGGLRLCGTWALLSHPSAEITRASYFVPYHGWGYWNPGEPEPTPLTSWVKNGGLVEAHNAQFEFTAWLLIAYLKLGWPPLAIEQMSCSQAKSRKHGFPGKLELVSKILRVAKKDMEGNKIMRKLCRPHTPTKTRPESRYTRERYPDMWARQAGYCDQDVWAEMAVSQALPELTYGERIWWLSEMRMVLRGVKVDRTLCLAAISLVRAETVKMDREIAQITDGAVKSYTQRDRMLKWINSHKSSRDLLPDLQKGTVDRVLSERIEIPQEIRRVLEIRRELSQGSVTKYSALMHWIDSTDDRLRCAYIWHGTHPGRHTGTGPQPANFPRGGNIHVKQCPTCHSFFAERHESCLACGTILGRTEDWNAESANQAIADVKTQTSVKIEQKWGPLVPLLGSCLRGAFISSPGYDLISSDYTAIQAVIVAALSGEEWRLDVFRKKKPLYLVAASKITGKSLSFYQEYYTAHGHHHEDRRLGKIAELAGCFQGWVNSWKKFGADKFVPNEEAIKNHILAWRSASPCLLALWYGLDNAAISAVKYPGKVFYYRDLSYYTRNRSLICRLPSGRELWYQEPEISRKPKIRYSSGVWPDIHGPRNVFDLSYMGYNTNPQNGPVGWVRQNTWGGKLTENAVMACEVDIMVDRRLALEERGYFPVLETYDEITCEVAEGYGSIEEYERILETLPPWCKDWPIHVDGGWRGKRFRKG